MRAPILALTVALAALTPAAAQTTLASVKQRGHLICGVNPGLIGFSTREGDRWSGFDVDFCRALAAAIFNDPNRVTFIPLTAGERFAALQSGRIDVLSRNSTWTLEREAALKLLFAATTYYDGQGFLVSAARNATSALELNGTKVCVQAGTTNELNVGDYFRDNGVGYELMAFTNLNEAINAYRAKRCEVYTADISQLYAIRAAFPDPNEHDILPDIISKEPLGPAVRQDDVQWFGIVRWIHFAMINAEELGVSSATLGQAMSSARPAVRRLLGTEGDYGEQLGLTKDWAARIIRHVGHYGEVYERNVGAQSRLGIPRGVNHLWTKGGLQYAPPIR
jgi:general L-amino acid transport system substrate-binding protein